MIQRTCQYCEKPFPALESEVRRGNARFCSRSCGAKHSGAKKKAAVKPNCECAFCHTSFYRNPSTLKNSKSGLTFCSRRCKDQAQRLDSNFPEIQPDHYGQGDRINVYRHIAFRNYPPVCAECGIEDLRVLVVHHKDGNRRNNVVSNLKILCSNCHQIEHFEDSQQLEDLRRLIERVWCSPN